MEIPNISERIRLHDFHDRVAEAMAVRVDGALDFRDGWKIDNLELPPKRVAEQMLDETARELG